MEKERRGKNKNRTCIYECGRGGRRGGDGLKYRGGERKEARKLERGRFSSGEVVEQVVLEVKGGEEDSGREMLQWRTQQMSVPPRLG